MRRVSPYYHSELATTERYISSLHIRGLHGRVEGGVIHGERHGRDGNDTTTKRESNQEHDGVGAGMSTEFIIWGLLSREGRRLAGFPHFTVLQMLCRGMTVLSRGNQEHMDKTYILKMNKGLL